MLEKTPKNSMDSWEKTIVEEIDPEFSLWGTSVQAQVLYSAYIMQKPILYNSGKGGKKKI